MPADQFAVPGEGDVAFDNAGALPGRRHVGFQRMLGELHAGAAMADGEVVLAKHPGAARLQLCLQGAILELIDQEAWPWAELGRDVDAAVVLALGQGRDGMDPDQDADRDGERRF